MKNDAIRGKGPLRRWYRKMVPLLDFLDVYRWDVIRCIVYILQVEKKDFLIVEPLCEPHLRKQSEVLLSFFIVPVDEFGIFLLFPSKMMLIFICYHNQV
jgi:hypothetical protein